MLAACGSPPLPGDAFPVVVFAASVMGPVRLVHWAAVQFDIRDKLSAKQEIS